MQGISTTNVIVPTVALIAIALITWRYIRSPTITIEDSDDEDEVKSPNN